MTDKKETPNNTWTATLRRGNSYVVFGKRFMSGEDVDITDEEKAYLEDNAVDVHVVKGELDEDGRPVSEARAKFSFREIGTELVSPKGRRRSRPAV